MTKNKTKKKYNRNNRFTRKNYVDRLKDLYPSCKFDERRDDYHLYESHKITYGEMQYEGIQQLYSHVKKINNHIDTFIDIGSGRGKLCMYMASQPEIRSVLGVELVTQRYNDAIKLQEDLMKDISKKKKSTTTDAANYGTKVMFLNQDILEVNLKNYLGKEAVFLWFSNLCFDQSTTNDIFQKLNEELPADSIICCSKEPIPVIGKPLNQLIIPMSWSKNSTVFMYQIL